MRVRFAVFFLLGAITMCLLAGFAYNLPPIHERLAWRVATVRAEIKRAINPPEQVVFVPQEQIEAIVQATLQALTPTPTATPTIPPTPTPTEPGPTATPVPTETPTPTPTPIPDSIALSGIRHEYQRFNNCGPANLSMALSYWGWQGDQYVTRAFLRPSHEIDDKNVNPYEMVDFVETQTDLKALWRVGGDLDLLKRLVAAGFPVIIERGLERANEPWLGHYQIISGYDDPRNQFIVHDSFIGPDRGYPIPQEEVRIFWRHFNNVYVVPYPGEREAEVMAILGPHADEVYNYEYAAQKAAEDVNNSSGREQYFAWFNLGTNLVYLEEYARAADAYDNAFAVYAALPQNERPWRMLWYQTGPYPAYYHTGRYHDLISLAQTTLVNVDKPVLEESYYWRGMAKEALGDRDGAIEDLRRAHNLNPRTLPAREQLLRLGVEVP